MRKSHALPIFDRAGAVEDGATDTQGTTTTPRAQIFAYYAPGKERSQRPPTPPFEVGNTKPSRAPHQPFEPDYQPVHYEFDLAWSTFCTSKAESYESFWKAANSLHAAENNQYFLITELLRYLDPEQSLYQHALIAIDRMPILTHYNKEIEDIEPDTSDKHWSRYWIEFLQSKQKPEKWMPPALDAIRHARRDLRSRLPIFLTKLEAFGNISVEHKKFTTALEESVIARLSEPGSKA